MQVNELVGQIQQGPPLPHVEQAIGATRGTAEARAERRDVDPSRRQATRPPGRWLASRFGSAPASDGAPGAARRGCRLKNVPAGTFSNCDAKKKRFRGNACVNSLTFNRREIPERSLGHS